MSGTTYRTRAVDASPEAGAAALVIGHHDCRWYKDARFHHLHAGSDERQHDDLRRVKAEMQARFPRMAVETWFARLEGAEARFDPEP